MPDRIIDDTIYNADKANAEKLSAELLLSGSKAAHIEQVDYFRHKGIKVTFESIEQVLTNYDSIDQAVVKYSEDKEGNRRLIAYVIPNGIFNQMDVTEYLVERIKPYMIPSIWICLEKFPLNLFGKVDKGALPDFNSKTLTGKEEYTAPRNFIEIKLAEIWQQLFAVDKVGIHDNFFELGGHSLRATRMISLIRKTLELELAIKDLFAHPTIVEIAGYLSAKTKGLLLPVIGIQPRFENIPLSFSQERLWFIDRLEGSIQYNMPEVLRLRGKLNKAALADAFKQIVNRHEVLRTVILENETGPYQYVLPKGGLQVTFIEGGLFNQSFRGLQQRIQQLINEPFDLSKDHMLRAALISLNENEHVLVATMHHIASDGWSVSVIVKEMIEFFNAFNEGRPAQLLPMEIQYVDYSIWQKKYLVKEILEDKIGYWKGKLQGATPLALPIDFARPAVLSRAGACVSFRIDKELSSVLHLLSQQQGTTLFMTLLAAFQVLLYRHSGQQDICIGTPIAGRQQQELEGLIGFFVNTLVLRTKLSGNNTFIDLLQQARITTLEAYEHQEVPFEKVVETLVKERDLSRSPLFQVMLVFQNTPLIQDLNLKGLNISRGVAGAAAHNTAKFELTFIITETARGLKCVVEYCTALYSEYSIKRMVGHFNELLHSIVKSPAQKIGLLPMLSKAEENLLLVDFNNTSSVYPSSATIADLFREQVQKQPGSIAMAFEAEQVTYLQMNERSNQLAHYLISKGVRSETMVPICIERSIDMLVGILGILKAGAAYVPIDPVYPGERINFMLEDIDANIILSSKAAREKIPTHKNIHVIEMDNPESPFHQELFDNLSTVILPENLAYVIYTSGSTGKPKGVMVTHNNVVSLVKGVSYISLNNNDILLSTGSSSFDATTFEYWGMLLNGGQLVLCNEKTLLDNKLLKEEIKKRGVNHMWFTSSWFNQLVEADITLFEKLETVLAGGEKLSEHHIEILRQTYPHIEIINGYGPTENTTFSTSYHIRETNISKPVAIGKPLSNRKALILDENAQLVPVGVSGEICLWGAGLSKGYLNQPELTAEKFVKNPFNIHEETLMYKTGDLGRWLQDGNIEYVGRIDEQVKIRGYRIELGEIENVLHQCESVTHAAVLAKEDNFGNKRLVAYIVPAQKFDIESMLSDLRGKIPAYMIPSAWMEMEQLPLTSNGKIDKRSLPDPDNSQLPIHQYEAPGNELETRMADLWQDLLGVEKVGISDDFFRLGGHSLHAIRLVSLIRRKMGIDISTNDVFIYPTIARLIASVLEKANNPSSIGKGIKYTVSIKTGGNKVPLYIVAGGGGTALRFRKFAELLDKDQTVYILQPPTDSKSLKEFPEEIESIAQIFVAEILLQNPNGPFALSGHCLGGIIAFEMARQLEQSGKKVQLLAMFDTILDEPAGYSPRSFKNLFHLTFAIKKALSKLILKIGFQFFLLKHHTRESFAYKFDKVKSLGTKIKWKKSDSETTQNGGMEIFNESADIYISACKKYKLIPYAGHIVAFYAKEHYYFLDKAKGIRYKKLRFDDDVRNRWKQYATKVSIHEIEGEHSEIFDPVNGDEFALLLQQHLNSDNL
ncbi:MAG: amino acid adenylation domain-containing protein [Ferruginibacter sp.]